MTPLKGGASHRSFLLLLLLFFTLVLKLPVVSLLLFTLVLKFPELLMFEHFSVVILHFSVRQSGGSFILLRFI